LNKREIAKAKREALRYLERARRTAKLKTIPSPSEHDVDEILMPDGSRYEDINDDIADMRYQLEQARLTPADIGTDEEELRKLAAASTRLNEPFRRRQESIRRNRVLDYDDDE